ncbi:MAG: T9SS type A sorting domain-containing protein [Clostridium sp.]|nr:T9SS type A sorting domain-containing protein [Clostridium sp.]
MKLRSICAAIAAGLTLSANAGLLTVCFANGSKTSFELADEPQVTFEEANIAIRAKGVTTTYPVSDVKQFVFNETTAVAEVADNETRFSFLTPDCVIVSGIKPAETVAVASVDGRLVSTTTASGEGIATVQLGELPAGVYIISTASGKTVKILH